MSKPDSQTMLLPCPFCGGQAKELENNWGEEGFSESENFVTCQMCGATVLVNDNGQNNEVCKKITGVNSDFRASEIWNHRRVL